MSIKFLFLFYKLLMYVSNMYDLTRLNIPIQSHAASNTITIAIPTKPRNKSVQNPNEYEEPKGAVAQCGFNIGITCTQRTKIIFYHVGKVYLP